MKVGFIGTYPPRECGIATFTQSLLNAIQSGSDVSANSDTLVIAMNDFKKGYEYPPEVVFTIDQEDQQDYIKAADFINYSDIDVCLLQHEYGIFGGESGIYVLSFINRLTTPFIVTFHTVLKDPSFLQKIILQEIANNAFKVVVMSNMAAEFLKDSYNISPEKIMLIEHGVPAFQKNSFVQIDLDKFKNKKLLFTFGLLSRNKGIETVIKALPVVAEKHPDILYIVLGNTHPAVLRHSGEEYRNYLKRLAVQLKVQEHVYFINKFVSDEQLFNWLREIEIYITPYNNEAQITSGTLSYAIGAGAAVVSTPYWHAQELLANQRGRLFPFKDSEALGELLNELLDNPEELKTIRHNAYQYGRYLKWPRIGARYWEAAAEATRYHVRLPYNDIRFPNADDIPAFNLTHVKRLTDNNGIVQHAKYGIPNLKEGYCLDDNARALLMITMAYRQLKIPEALDLLPVYLSFVHYMQTDGGHFRNFLHFNRSYLDEIGTEDSFGRNMWALGYLIRYAPNNSYREFAGELFSKSFAAFNELTSIRGYANTVIGICHYLTHFQADEGMIKTLIELTNKLMAALNKESDENWYWFEDTMTYDNGILPLALLHSYEITGNTAVKEAALKALNFLAEKTFHKNYLTPVGNDGWFKKGGEMPLFDQQAIEVMAMVLLFEQAYQVTKDSAYIQLMCTSFMWFLGENELHIPLYDHETHGCCDGLQYNGINRNQGAESTLAYLIAHLTVLKAMEKEYEYKKHAQAVSKKEFAAV
jgi:glycosyltransferase involved in cell wall biosynthesis